MSRAGNPGDAGPEEPGAQRDSGHGVDDVIDDPDAPGVGPAVEQEGHPGKIKENLKEGLREVEARLSPTWQARMARFRERIRSRPLLDTAWRVGVFTLGVTLVAAGLVMFVIPGPGFATVILGLVVLASEFAWASRALDPVKAAARRASEAALDPRRRRRNLILAGIAGAIAAAALSWYLRYYGLTMQPILNLLAAVMAWFKGLF